MSCDNTTADLSSYPAIAGDPYVVSFDFTDSADDAVDLTDYTAALVAKMDPDAATYDVELDETDGIELGTTSGRATATIPTTDLIGVVHFRLTITPPNAGNPDSVQGKFTVNRRT